MTRIRLLERGVVQTCISFQTFPNMLLPPSGEKNVRIFPPAYKRHNQQDRSLRHHCTNLNLKDLYSGLLGLNLGRLNVNHLLLP
jgi:hypothetical protein